MFAKQSTDGNWYVAKMATLGGKGHISKTGQVFRNIHHIRAYSLNQGSVTIGNLKFPKEFIGKRIRLKIEEVD